MSSSNRVLVVDDDRQLAKLVIEYLHTSGPFQVDWANSIRGLWKQLETSQYDMILLDYKLPDGTGMEALKEFNQRGVKTPVVMITGRGDERLAVQAIQHGVIDYLVKGDNYLPSLPSLIRRSIREQQLQRSIERTQEQNRYQVLLLNNVRDAIVVWDTEGKITHWNPAAEVLFGYKASERLGLPVEECYLTAFEPAVNVPSKESTCGQEVGRCYKKMGGEVVWVSSRVAALRDYGAGGRLIGYMDVSRDITSRKNAEDALRTERNFVSTVLDTVGALVVVLDSRGKIVRFNRACEQVTGYSFKEVVGKAIWDLFLPPEEIKNTIAVFEQLATGNSPKQYENQWLTRHGKRRWIAWSNTALLNSDGQVKYYIATGIDITERKQAEQALSESENRHRAVSELVSDYVYSLRVEPQGAIICEWITDSFTRISGFDPIGMDWNENWKRLTHPDDAYKILEMGKALFSGKRHMCELRVISEEGEVRWLRNYAQPVWDAAAGRVVHIYGAAQDISEHRHMQNQIQAAQTRITQSARLAAIGELAAGVAHHINNPLTTIIAEAQLLLQDTGLEQTERESLEAIEKAGWRVQKTVQQLLDFSRPTADTLERLVVNKTIRSALGFVSEVFRSSGTTLEVDLDESLPPVHGNARQLGDLWLNLLMLARDATADGQPHTLRVRSELDEGGTVLVTVHDDGRIIPPEEMPTLFEPNFIMPAGGRGTGIELNICQEIVRQHNGKITARSGVEDGTTFYVYLPVGT